MSKVKICGLKCRKDIETANKYMPDYIGFVFSKSPRQINIETARALKRELSPKITAVGVFVNEPPDFVLDLCRGKIIDMVQLHGDEDDEYIRRLKSETDCKIIRAVRVTSPQQVMRMEKCDCDYLLLDAYKKGSYGGNGVCFNWDLIPENLSKQYFLAGGLNSENVAGAIKRLHPYCVDLSSAAETNGVKDEAKVREIIKKVRSAK